MFVFSKSSTRSIKHLVSWLLSFLYNFSATLRCYFCEEKKNKTTPNHFFLLKSRSFSLQIQHLARADSSKLVYFFSYPSKSDVDFQNEAASVQLLRVPPRFYGFEVSILNTSFLLLSFFLWSPIYWKSFGATAVLLAESCFLLRGYASSDAIRPSPPIRCRVLALSPWPSVFVTFFCLSLSFILPSRFVFIPPSSLRPLGDCVASRFDGSVVLRGGSPAWPERRIRRE